MYTLRRYLALTQHIKARTKNVPTESALTHRYVTHFNRIYTAQFVILSITDFINRFERVNESQHKHSINKYTFWRCSLINFHSLRVTFDVAAH